MATKKLWEILVPSHSNEGKVYQLTYHREWDDKVRKITGGLTIFKTVKGQWISQEGEILFDRMIPVRIYCTENEINQIIQLTLKHYAQKAILAYEISSNVKLVHRR